MTIFKKSIAASLIASTAALSLPAKADPYDAPWYDEGYTVIEEHHYHTYRPSYDDMVRAQIYADVQRRERRKDRNEAIALGVAGLVLGAIVMDQATKSRPSTSYYDRTYQRPADNTRNTYPDYYANTGSYRAASRQRPAQTGGESWIGSADWRAYCSQRYRTFDPASGTFMHNSGVRKLCR